MDLWAYASDDQSSVEELSYSVLSSSDDEVNAYIIDNRYVSIDLIDLNWLGTSTIELQVNDGEYSQRQSFSFISQYISSAPFFTDINIPKEYRGSNEGINCQFYCVDELGLAEIEISVFDRITGENFVTIQTNLNSNPNEEVLFIQNIPLETSEYSILAQELLIEAELININGISSPISTVHVLPDDDDAGPEIFIDVPDEISYYDDVIHYSITCSDPSGISQILTYISDSETGPLNSVTTEFQNTQISQSIELSFDLHTLAYDLRQKEFVIHVTSSDADGDSQQDCKISEASAAVILDDDVTPPEIDIEYIGDYTDGHPGGFEVNINEDISGISEIEVSLDGNVVGNLEGIYYLDSSELQKYDFCVIAENDDSERGEEDQEKNVKSISVVLTDDDIEAPETSIEEILFFRNQDDKLFGEITLLIQDYSGISQVDCFAKLLDGSGLIIPLFTDDETSISSETLRSYSFPMRTMDYDLVETDFEICFIVTDNDKDRTDDTMVAEPFSQIISADDDLTPPEIYGSSFNFNDLNWDVSILDDDGIEDSQATAYYEVLNEQSRVIQSGEILEEETIHSINLPLKTGTFTLSVTATNNDNDRPGDEEISIYEDTVTITLEDTYNFVDGEFNDLEDYIDDNLWSILGWIVGDTIEIAENLVNDAYHYVDSGCTVVGLIHDALSQAVLEIAEFEVEFYNNLWLISDEDANYIVDAINDLKQDITLLMGLSVETEHGYTISVAERDLMILEYDLEENFGTEVCCLNTLIDTATMKLETAIFMVAMEFDTECMLCCALSVLDSTVSETEELYSDSHISQAERDNIIQQITSVQELIIEAINML